MHQLPAAKSDVVWVEALLIVAFMIPLSQFRRLSCGKCRLRLLCSVPSTTFCTARPFAGALRYAGSPLMLAIWALPFSPEVAASQHLLRGFLILGVVPVLDYFWCYSCKRVMQADLPICTVWTLGTSCSVLHYSFPDMWLARWTVVTLPHGLVTTVGCDLDCSQVHISFDMPLLLQLQAQHADVW